MVQPPQQSLPKKCIISRTIGFLCLTPSLQNLCDLIEKYRNLKKEKTQNHNSIVPEQPTSSIVPGYMEIMEIKSIHTPIHSSAYSMLLFYNLKRFFIWIYDYIFHKTHNHKQT
jgi:hypothetical protein